MRSFPLLRVVPTRPIEAAPGRWLRDREQHRTVFGSYEDGRASTSSMARRRCARTGVGCEAAWTQVFNWRRRRKHGIWWLPMLVGAARARRRAGRRCERAAAPTTRASARAPVASRSSSRVGAAWDQDHKCNCVGVQATRQLRQRGMVAVVPTRPFKSGGCRARGG